MVKKPNSPQLTVLKWRAMKPCCFHKILMYFVDFPLREFDKILPPQDDDPPGKALEICYYYYYYYYNFIYTRYCFGGNISSISSRPKCINEKYQSIHSFSTAFRLRLFYDVGGICFQIENAGRHIIRHKTHREFAWFLLFLE